MRRLGIAYIDLKSFTFFVGLFAPPVTLSVTLLVSVEMVQHNYFLDVSSSDNERKACERTKGDVDIFSSYSEFL